MSFSSLTQMPLVHLLSATAWIDLFWTERVEYGWLFCLRSHIGTMVVNFFCSVWILYILRLYLLFSALQTVNGPSHPSPIISMNFFTFLGFFSITSKNFTKFSKIWNIRFCYCKPFNKLDGKPNAGSFLDFFKLFFFSLFLIFLIWINILKASGKQYYLKWLHVDKYECGEHSCTALSIMGVSNIWVPTLVQDIEKLNQSDSWRGIIFKIPQNIDALLVKMSCKIEIFGIPVG